MNSNVRAFVVIASFVDDSSLELDDDFLSPRRIRPFLRRAKLPCVTASRAFDAFDTIARIRVSLNRRASRDGVEAVE